jgi:hypothetical protein
MPVPQQRGRRGLVAVMAVLAEDAPDLVLHHADAQRQQGLLGQRIVR